MLHRNSHFSVCPCRAHMPRPDICSRWCRRRRRSRRRRRRRLRRRCSPPAHGSPSSFSSFSISRSLSLCPTASSSFVDPLSLALSHSCHAARTSDNSTALRGKAKSRRPTPAFSFWRILLSFSFSLGLACALSLPSRPVRLSPVRERVPLVPCSCSCSCSPSSDVRFAEPDARVFFYFALRYFSERDISDSGSRVTVCAARTTPRGNNRCVIGNRCSSPATFGRYSHRKKEHARTTFSRRSSRHRHRHRRRQRP